MTTRFTICLCFLTLFLQDALLLLLVLEYGGGGVVGKTARMPQTQCAPSTYRLVDITMELQLIEPDVGEDTLM